MRGRILTDVRVDDVAPAVVSRPNHVLDDATRELLERETARARAEGEAAGRAAGVAAARAESTAVAVALEQAAARLDATLREQHAALARALGERVLDAVTAVLGHEPGDDGRRLLDRVVAAVAAVDDDELRVRVAPRHEALVRAEVGDAVTVVADPTLGDDDALLDGAFAHVDLRRGMLLEALEELLHEAAPLGPLPAPEDEGQHP